jgi:hypothetical protein
MEILDIAMNAFRITFAVSPAFYSNSVNPNVFSIRRLAGSAGKRDPH